MDEQLIEGKHFYYSEEGFIVFTAFYHQQKGYCCGNGCRHCPFNYEAVPEPRRTELLQENNEKK